MGPSAPEPAAAPAELPPTLEALVGRFGGGPVRLKEIRSLHRWLSSLSWQAPLDACAAALEDGARWLHAGPAMSGDEPGPTARLRLLLDVLDLSPAWRRTFAGTVTQVLAGTSALPLFESGLPNDRGLLDETTDRLARRFLPTPRDERDLAEHLGRWFPRARDADWIEGLPPELVARLAQAVADDGARDPWSEARQALLDAVALVAARTSALGLSRDMRARSPELALAASPFFLLPRLCDALLDGIGSAASCREQIAACRETLEIVHGHLEEFGVSVDVVYRIEVANRNLDRLADLLAVVDARDPDERSRAAAALVARLVGAHAREGSFRDLLRTNVRLLARKIIERAGETGEHYITATRREWWKMIASAGGGGVLTAGTTALKYLIVGGHFPLFVEGFFASTNYALSFVLMQLLGFTLATKQPSMTAAALAGALKESSTPKLDELVTLIARICRSQLAAALGNVCFVIPTVIGFNWLYARSAGHPFLDEHAAEHTLESFHPLHSGTIYFAALTGVLLWLSSLGAGWLENWATYRKIFAGVEQHRLGKIFGRRFMAWLGRKLHHHISGFGGNITLGILLGMVPVFGKFLGVPLEVRHVTLSTGGLTFAVCTLGVHAPGLIAAACGIGCMLALNFGVSFALALGVAMRARGVEHGGLRLLGAVLSHFVRSPREFFLPPAA
jgi:site-specific recombinase